MLFPSTGIDLDDNHSNVAPIFRWFSIRRHSPGRHLNHLVTTCIKICLMVHDPRFAVRNCLGWNHFDYLRVGQFHEGKHRRRMYFHGSHVRKRFTLLHRIRALGFSKKLQFVDTLALGYGPRQAINCVNVAGLDTESELVAKMP